MSRLGHTRIAARRSVAATTVLLLGLPALLKARFELWETRGREEGRDAGYSTETVIITAMLVVLALAVIGIISRAVIDKANGISL
ncbi:hypothetical protein Ga0074812_15035 [Parafrankia irregularis]|uniref:Uncharacterized protein n=1 Tax=Parafrankia irregularis TaxID=795642 RepID=A0A0S4QZI9_9ACTN|nr:MULTISPECIES: hypothetical protein [Parafrankia]CUU60935.1 hypothetical protein Ga0074812_15035 [Parafrankia irregularis]